MEVREQVDYLLCSHCNQNDKGNVSGSSDQTKMAPFKWRKNSTKEVRHMRNQRKKRKRLQKKNIPSVTVAKENYERLIQKEQAQKGRFLFLARKYYLKWKAVKEAHRNLRAKANPTNVVCGSGLKFLNGARVSLFPLTRSLGRVYVANILGSLVARI